MRKSPSHRSLPSLLSSPPWNLVLVLRLLTTSCHFLSSSSATAFQHHGLANRLERLHRDTAALSRLHVNHRRNGRRHRHTCHETQLFIGPPANDPDPRQQQTLDVWPPPPPHPLSSLLAATARASHPRRLDTTRDAHEAFRYEWGTWCDVDALNDVIMASGEIRLRRGAYDELCRGTWGRVLASAATTTTEDEEEDGSRRGGKRIRIAGGKYWDVILHVLPKNA